jgi:hypothetical protein
MVLAFLFFLWLAVEVVSISVLAPGGSGVFQQAPPARSPEPTPK